jgi:pimeloyl-ACP methyl ester carboxylesterase
LTGGVQFPGSVDDLARMMQRFQDEDFLKKFLIDNARRFGTAGKLLFPIPDRGLVERLYRVRSQAVLIWGASDRLIGKPYAEAFARLLPRARLCYVEAAGHMVPYEQPQAVIDAIGTLAA